MRKYLGGELGIEVFIDENVVSVHEMAKAVLNTVYEYCFHHAFFFFFGESERD